MLIQLKKNLFKPVIGMLTVLFFLSCQKDVDNIDVPEVPVVPADLTTKVISSVSGFVTNETNQAVVGATVKVGAITKTTDDYGFFEAKNVEVVKNAAVVTVEKSGYFKGIKTYIGTEGKSAFFRIKLIPKTNTGTISSSAGGDVTLTNGLKISLPANAVVNASSSAAYSGTINVASYWIDPTSTDLSEIMPGDLRGLNDESSLKRLTTYGMAAIELTGGSGELLQIGAGKTATLTMPVPSSILSSAPATIPLWSFDEAKGLWKQEGQATKSGNNYVGDVSHFSFWNCDVPNNYVQFDCTVINSSGAPIPYTSVKISVVGSPNMAAWGYTDSSGYVSGAIPDNAQLLLEVFTAYSCGTVLYSQNFTTTTVNVSLGNITINTGSSLATLSGTVTDCNSVPLADGYIIMYGNNQYFRYPVSNTGTYNFTALFCNNPTVVTLIAEDNVALQQSTPLTYTVVSGANVVGNLQACGVTTAEFITYSLDGGVTNTTFSAPMDSVVHSGNGTSGLSYIMGSGVTGYLNFGFDNTGIAVGSVQTLLSFSAAGNPPSQQYTINPPTNVVNITEYGPVGGFIAGNFSASLTGISPPTTYPATCTFRVRRNF